MGKRAEKFLAELREASRVMGREAEFEAFYKRFGVPREIARRRETLHLSQKALAERSGISQNEISLIERGVGNPTLRTLSAIAFALGGRVEIVFASKPSRRRGVSKRATRSGRGRHRQDSRAGS